MLPCAQLVSMVSACPMCEGRLQSETLVNAGNLEPDKTITHDATINPGYFGSQPTSSQEWPSDKLVEHSKNQLHVTSRTDFRTRHFSVPFHSPISTNHMRGEND